MGQPCPQQISSIAWPFDRSMENATSFVRTPLMRQNQYECVYLKAYESVSQARSDIARYIDWYNAERGHSSHAGQTPDEVWLAGLPELQEVA